MLRALTAGIIGCFIAVSAWADSATFGVAVSLKEAMTQIGRDYESSTGTKINFSFGSSGQILTQIKGGAAVDGFISAANQQIDTAIKDGLADPASRRIVVSNTLVLIVPTASAVNVQKFEDLSKADVKKIAMGEPKTVPCGLYTNEVFAALKIGDQVKDRLVYGSNVRQVLDYVQRGEVDAGVVYRTDALHAGASVKVVATADLALHQPIVYPAVLLKDGANRQSAQKFLDYLQGDKARAVFSEHGFCFPEAAPVSPVANP